MVIFGFCMQFLKGIFAYFVCNLWNFSGLKSVLFCRLFHLCITAHIIHERIQPNEEINVFTGLVRQAVVAVFPLEVFVLLFSFYFHC